MNLVIKKEEMKMVKSDLATEVYEADDSNYTQGRRGYDICKITPHHMAGVLTAEECGNIFQNPNRQASSNYGIGVDGEIACYVGEENRAWTSSSAWNDCQAITIEVSNCDVGDDWPISDESWDSLVNLCVDICRRYDFRLDYTGDKYGSLTRHNMFANTNCPGPYLQSRLDYLADEVNRILDGDQPTPTPPVPSGDEQIVEIQEWCNYYYNTDIDEDGYYGPQTKKAIIEAYQTELNLQFDAGLDVDGIFGPATRAATVIVSEGDEGDLTKSIQSMLYCLGYNTNGVDGIYGPGTKNAVINFQKNNGLYADGIFGKNTATKLFS
jgi:N-acetyl-anhydromuramyl-L-alanine amidase AmpD